MLSAKSHISLTTVPWAIGPPVMTLVCLLHLTKDRDLILDKWKLVNKRTLFSTMAGLSGPRASLQAASVNDFSPSIDKYSWFRVLSAIWSASCFSTFATTGNTIGFPSLSRKAKIAGKKESKQGIIRRLKFPSLIKYENELEIGFLNQFFRYFGKIYLLFPCWLC